MPIRDILLIALLHFIPKRMIRFRLERRIATAPYRFYPRFSGRVAVFLEGRRLRERSQRDVALIPDYICNVVPRALAAAGWQIETYPTDRFMEADWSSIVRRTEGGDVGLIVGASVFGSSGLLDHLSQDEKVALLRTRGVHVLVDLAQDIRLVRRMPSTLTDFVTGIVSFNDKSFPGVMGGGLIASVSTGHDAPMIRMTWRQAIGLYCRAMWPAIMTMLQRFRRKRVAGRASVRARFDYSFCESFPFEIERPLEPSKLQYAMALVGMNRLDRYARAKALKVQSGLFLPTRFAATAAYLVLDTDAGNQADGLRKMPYALEGEPEKSLRPTQVVIHNKGFCDD